MPNLSKYWTELSSLVGLLLTVLTFVNGIGFLPPNVHVAVGLALAAVTWVAVNVFHRKSVAAARAEMPPRR